MLQINQSSSGICECGCGERTNFFRGKYNKFIIGHNHRGERNVNYGKDMSGINNPSWKGGKHNHSGYILVMVKNHPYGDNRGYVREHRLVYEKHLTELNGIPTYIHPSIEIDYINEIKNDNRLVNLRLFSKSNHSRNHGIKRGGLNGSHS